MRLRLQLAVSDVAGFAPMSASAQKRAPSRALRRQAGPDRRLARRQRRARELGGGELRTRASAERDAIPRRRLTPSLQRPSSGSGSRRSVPALGGQEGSRILTTSEASTIPPPAVCPRGFPASSISGLFPLQIIQTPKQMVILYEYMNVFRVIPLNAKHSDDMVPTYYGRFRRATGRETRWWWIWSASTTRPGSPAPGHSTPRQLHITERYTRIDKDQIKYDVTMEDPKVLTKPWTIHSTLMLREGTRVQEYVCAENNLDPGNFEKLLKDGVKFTRQ